MSKNIAQIYIANPRTVVGDNDLFYLAQNGIADGAMVGSVFNALFPLTPGTGTSSVKGGVILTDASGDYSFCIGNSLVTPSNATGLFSFSYGAATECHGAHSFALGDLSYVFVSASFSFAFGLACTVTESYSFAIGNNARANFAGSWVIGDSTINPIQDTAANQYRLTFNGGYYLQGSSLTASTMLGLDADKKIVSVAMNPIRAASGFRSAVGGNTATIASGSDSFAYGNAPNPTPTNVSGDNSFAFGSSITIAGLYSVGFGLRTAMSATSWYSFAHGIDCNTNGNFNFAWGLNANANFDGSWVVGDSNTTPIADDAVDQFRLTFNGGYYLQGSSLTASTILGLDSNKKVVSLPGNILSWNNVAGTTQSAAINNGYIISNASQTTVTLPATAAQGSIVAVQGFGASGWILTANSGQTIRIGNQVTSTAGSLTSTNLNDSVEVICVVANTTWSVRNFIGVLTVT